MNFDHEDEKLESYLQQFRAQAPRPLPRERKQEKVRVAVLVAIAALILLAIGVFAMRHAQSNSRQLVKTTVEPQPAAAEVSMIQLSRVAQQDPESLGNHLDSLSPRLLPDVRSGKGVLHHLARE